MTNINTINSMKISVIFMKGEGWEEEKSLCTMRGWEAIDEETNTGTWWAELKERIRTGPFLF